jgi:hypothetical protein
VKEAFKASAKNFFNWLSWRKVRRACYWLLFAWVLLFGLSSCTMKWVKMNAISSYMKTLDPQELRDTVNWRRANWINTCVNNGAAGVLGGATIAADAIEACKRTGFELFPEQDWVALAKANRNESYEQFLWDTRP